MKAMGVQRMLVTSQHRSTTGKLLSVGRAFSIPGSQLLLHRRDIKATMNKGVGSKLVRGEKLSLGRAFRAPNLDPTVSYGC
eukprot:15297176-Heterocapsa_arctica.AAC.1